MANPQRIPDPRFDDPISHAPIPDLDPQTSNPRFDPANRSDPALDSRPIVRERGGGSGVLIAAVIVVLAVAAYFMFAPREAATPVAPNEPVATQPAPDAAAPAPSAAAPADPAAPDTAAPNAMAPADPAAPAPESAAPAPAQ